MKKLTIILIVICLISVKINAQENPEDEKRRVKEEIEATHKKLNQEYLQEVRRQLSICILVTRFKLEQIKEEVDIVRQNFQTDDQKKQFNDRLLVDMVDMCQQYFSGKQNQEEVLVLLNTNKLKFENFPEMYRKLDLEYYSIDEWSLFLDEQKQGILKYITLFDEKMAKQPKKEPFDESKYKAQFEPKIGGLSLNETSPFLKYLYFGIMFVVISSLIYYGYKQTDDSVLVKGQKDKKKNKKNN